MKANLIVTTLTSSNLLTQTLAELSLGRIFSISGNKSLTYYFCLYFPTLIKATILR
jgi:hypothetical protein